MSYTELETLECCDLAQELHGKAVVIQKIGKARVYYTAYVSKDYWGCANVADKDWYDSLGEAMHALADELREEKAAKSK